MASIFTFETEPLQVASPWPPRPLLDASHGHGLGPASVAGLKVPPARSPADFGITKLEAEPQEGPVEYKLHLLLRPRRSYSATSTVQKVSGSYLSKTLSPGSTPEPANKPGSASPALAPSNSMRQNRLQSLTTQLLWRLQQSTPNHTSSKSGLVLPRLPEADVALTTSNSPGKLISGLGESLGALYEIGVSDDGFFVGLTMDELEESLAVLRAMAFSLGCNLRVLRIVFVGNCQWEESNLGTISPIRLRKEKLWVAEVLVAPCFDSTGENLDANMPGSNTSDNVANPKERGAEPQNKAAAQNEQLRISLTGSTTSGKSSLLGTLSTSTLDNGRGKSRLSLLKHRHEIVSGITSSLAQELIGYHDVSRGDGILVDQTEVVNYASGNVSSWTDIHNASEPGRLVFVTDSAGHPRYRRTTVRGLISWAPHWTLCCIAADDEENSAGKVGATASSSDILGSAGHGVDLSKAHLELCLKLDLPLVVVITKLDLASRIGLRQTLAKVLSILKSVGRKPVILPMSSDGTRDIQLASIAKSNLETIDKSIATVDPSETHLLVPIVLTSVVTGSGMSTVHALLRRLPILPNPVEDSNDMAKLQPSNDIPQTLFHVDELFTVGEGQKKASAVGSKAWPRFILSGYLRYGALEAGQDLLLGPFTSDTGAEDTDDSDLHRASSYPGLIKASPKMSSALSQRPRTPSSGLPRVTHDIRSRSKVSESWQAVHVTSIRNLRLPVPRLVAGQVGTIAIFTPNRLLLDADPCVRRGMVLIDGGMHSPIPELAAYTRFSAVFREPNAYVIPGSSVTVYIASIRALAKILEVRIPDSTATSDAAFVFDDRTSDAGDLAATENPIQLEEIEITFQFINCREWVEVGTPVLITPASGLGMLSLPQGGDAGVCGLDGFVGKIVGASG